MMIRQNQGVDPKTDIHNLPLEAMSISKCFTSLTG